MSLDPLLLQCLALYNIRSRCSISFPFTCSFLVNIARSIWTCISDHDNQWNRVLLIFQIGMLQSKLNRFSSVSASLGLDAAQKHFKFSRACHSGRLFKYRFCITVIIPIRHILHFERILPDAVVFETDLHSFIYFFDCFLWIVNQTWHWISRIQVNYNTR